VLFNKSTSNVFARVCAYHDVDILLAMLRRYIAEHQDKSAHYILKYDYVLLCDLALKGLIDMNSIDKKGKGVLHWAASYNHPKNIKYLCSLGVQPNDVDNKGKTPLHYACKYCAVEAVKELLEIDGIDVFIKDKKGKSSLEVLKASGKKINEQNRRAIEILLKMHISKKTS